MDIFRYNIKTVITYMFKQKNRFLNYVFLLIPTTLIFYAALIKGVNPVSIITKNAPYNDLNEIIWIFLFIVSWVYLLGYFCNLINYRILKPDEPAHNSFNIIRILKTGLAASIGTLIWYLIFSAPRIINFITGTNDSFAESVIWILFPILITVLMLSLSFFSIDLKLSSFFNFLTMINALKKVENLKDCAAYIFINYILISISFYSLIITLPVIVIAILIASSFNLLSSEGGSGEVYIFVSVIFAYCIILPYLFYILTDMSAQFMRKIITNTDINKGKYCKNLKKE